jgi:TDG/mug DNA glycosylase family protein
MTPRRTKSKPKSTKTKLSTTPKSTKTKASALKVSLRTTLGDPWRPSREQQLKSIRKRVPDLIAPNLDVLFCGINPGLYSAAVGHHFAGPGNLFWSTLLAAGLTSRLLSAFDEAELLALGYGITNLVPRTTASAEEVDKVELRRGAKALRRKVRQFKPRFLAICGIVAYRVGFERNKAMVGLQEDRIGDTAIWLLPNPSGLNAFHQPSIMNQMFTDFRVALEAVRAAVPRETEPSAKP